MNHNLRKTIFNPIPYSLCGKNLNQWKKTGVKSKQSLPG